jgi:hypothetical protein
MKVPGKALYIRGGTYAGMVSTEGGGIRGGLTADTPTRIEGYQAEPVTIQLPVGGVNAVELNGVSNVALQKLTVDAMARAESNALACMHSSNITIKNSVFRNAFYEVAYFNGCNQVTITQSQFQGALNGAAIILASDSMGITFDEVDVSTSALGGIETHPNRQTTNLTITRSQFRDTGKGAGGAAIDLGPGKGARIIGNMFDHNQAGIRVRQGVSGAVLTDLMMASTAGAALQCDPGSSLTLKNIVTFSNGDDRKGDCLTAVKKTGKGQ